MVGPNFEGYSTGVWVPALGAFVTWMAGGTGFDVLTPPTTGSLTSGTWKWSRMECSAANTVTPDAVANNGDYGRFFYSPELNCLGVVTSTAGQINIFALP